jgi:hypothetical protein
MSWGFVKAPLADCADRLSRFGFIVGTKPYRKTLRTPLCKALRELEPFSHGSTAFLLVEHGHWTACFDNEMLGGEPEVTVPLLSRDLKSSGLTIAAVPDLEKPRLSYGQLKLEYYVGTECVRALAITNDGGSWDRDETGARQPFEGNHALEEWMPRSGLLDDTPLESICANLGIRLFDESAYGPRAELVRAHAKGIKLAALRRQRGWA